MKLLLAIAAATLCFAAAESRVSRASILFVENAINEKLSSHSPVPFDLIGTARGTYLEGYGALFTTELDLINAGTLNLTPFRPAISKEEKAATRESKVKNLVELKDTMRNLIANASVTLEGLPANERVAMETILFYYTWEEPRGLPHRVFMSAVKQKLLDAKAAHAGQPELAAIIEEQER